MAGLPTLLFGVPIGTILGGASLDFHDVGDPSTMFVSLPEIFRQYVMRHQLLAAIGCELCEYFSRSRLDGGKRSCRPYPWQTKAILPCYHCITAGSVGSSGSPLGRMTRPTKLKGRRAVKPAAQYDAATKKELHHERRAGDIPGF